MLRNGSSDSGPGGSGSNGSGAGRDIPRNSCSMPDPMSLPGPMFGKVPDQQRNGRMASLIQDEIIPRLVAAHWVSPAPRAPASASRPTGSPQLDADSVADLALAPDPGSLMGVVESVLAAGLPVADLLVDVLAPAARCLGRRWEDDTADFIDVTMGLWRLQEVVHLLPELPVDDSTHVPGRPRHILLAMAPGDTHSFGSVMLEELFRRQGWNCRSCRGADADAILAEASGNWFDVIALTASLEEHAEVLAGLVCELRARSRNADVSIMVGGRIFCERPRLADDIGADATAADGRAAVTVAEMLVEDLDAERGLYRRVASGPRSRASFRSAAPG